MLSLLGTQYRFGLPVLGTYRQRESTGKIRGVYLQENEAVEPIFSVWMQPFNDLGMNTLTMRDTGGTDHESFDAVGIPGFQFIQHPVEYMTRTHHSNADVYERIQRDDMMQAAVILAAYVLRRRHARQHAAAQTAAETSDRSTSAREAVVG